MHAAGSTPTSYISVLALVVAVTYLASGSRRNIVSKNRGLLSETSNSTGQYWHLPESLATDPVAIGLVFTALLDLCLILNFFKGLTTFDAMLTFSREVDCVWRRNFTFITILYLIQRYGLLVEHIFGLINAVLESPSVIVCFLRYLLAHHLAHFDYRAISSLRVLAITGRSWVSFIIVLLPNLFVIGSNIYNLGRVKRFDVLPGGGCTYSVRSPQPFAAAILVDLLVLGITWFKTTKISKFARNNNINLSLSTLLLRDGSIQFTYASNSDDDPLLTFGPHSALAVMNIVCAVFDTIPATIFMNGATFVIVYQESSIILSRFILDLRSVYMSDTNSGSGRTSSVRFATQISGNIGAPLEEASTWTTNAADNEPEPMLFSDDPMVEVLTSRPIADPEVSNLTE
ncbi:hypothetical protein NLI96_g10774 [Meripilus lineatus]|uniref:DUF6533 domain-containing protein n=1 Tax=Meripilus lineatus TaxID=2056292 RepID=A0AAD5Y901_9APHY|nr:hypothetical protein NLI96_g10774 [Physisporinus lineatus]